MMPAVFLYNCHCLCNLKGCRYSIGRYSIVNFSNVGVYVTFEIMLLHFASGFLTCRRGSALRRVLSNTA
jgi:hypothetical protein